MHAATVGAHTTNDRCESNFGTYGEVVRASRYIAVENASGIAQQMRMHDFERASTVAHDRRKRKAGTDGPAPSVGFYHTLGAAAQEALVNAACRERANARSCARADLTDHDAAKLARREERTITLLNAAIEHYAYAMELFDSWEANGARTKANVEAALKGHSEAAQLEYLRRQIEMRVLGLGWTQFATRWSSQADERIGTVAHLKALLVGELLPEEATLRLQKRLPTEAAPPHHSARDLGCLGTKDADALELESKALFSASELKTKAEAAVARRVAAGISDDVEGRQPPTAPAFDQQLVGKRLEVLWKYTDRDTGKPVMIWATGRVARVADGLTNTRSARARKILPAGALLWAWDADPEFGEKAGEQWLILLPKKWNTQQIYGWRFDPRELGGERARATVSRNVRACPAPGI